MKKLFIWGGIAAGAVLLAMGIGSIVIGAKKSGLQNVDLPSCTVANQAIETGSQARCFADYMRIHTLEATGGQTYAEMPRYMGKNGKPTNNEAKAAIDPKTGGPADNTARNIWVTSTALSTALNTSYFAEQVSVFSIVMGGAMLIVGIGLLVLTLGVLRPRFETAATAKPKLSTPEHAPA